MTPGPLIDFDTPSGHGEKQCYKITDQIPPTHSGTLISSDSEVPVVPLGLPPIYWSATVQRTVTRTCGVYTINLNILLSECSRTREVATK